MVVGALCRRGAQERERNQNRTHKEDAEAADNRQKLKYQLQCQLDLARRPNTRYAAKGAGRCCSRNVLCGHEGRVETGELRVIQEVEELGAKLQLGIFATRTREPRQSEVLEQREI